MRIDQKFVLGMKVFFGLNILTLYPIKDFLFDDTMMQIEGYQTLPNISPLWL